MGVWLFVVTMIPVFLLLMFIPYWTRKTESFGVSIPEEVYDQVEMKLMRKQYVWVMALLSVIMIGVFSLLAATLGNSESTTGILFGVIITLYMVISFFIYLYFYSRVKTHKQEEKWSEKRSQLVVLDTGFRNQKLTHSNHWFWIPLAMSIVTMIITLITYQRIPERIPMQYNFSGEVTNYAEKSYRSVLFMPMMQVYLTMIFLFVNSIIERAKQQISAEETEKSIQQNVTFRRRWSAFTIVSGIALISLFSFVQLSFIYPFDQKLLIIVSLILTFGMVLGAIVLAVTTGQGGSRVKVNKEVGGKLMDRDDDQYWKLGQFYFNRNDPALFLEKRFGIGWTNNWAHPLSWIILLVIIGLAIGIPLLFGV